MTPDSSCGSCRHALKWHNPCSKCQCMAFTATRAALEARGSVAKLPTGSVLPDLLSSGHVEPSGLIVAKGGKR